MFESVTGNALWQLVRQSDLLSKGVLLTLFFMSVLCWTIFFCKFILLRLRRRDIRRVLYQLQSIRTLQDVQTIATAFSHTVPGRFLTQAFVVYGTLEALQPEKSHRNWDIMQYHIDQNIDQLVALEESYLPALSTSAAVATLLGLFGTVWGLIHSFISISERQSADITVVAPGIAEALTTTLAGLIVAIPALVMYNYLLSQIRKIEFDIVTLGDKVTFIMQQAMSKE